MRLDVERVGGGISGDDGLGRLTEAAGEARLVDEGADVVGTEGAGGEGASDAVGDFGFAVAIDEAHELADFAFQIDAAARDLLEVDAALGRERRDAILALGACGSGPALDELFDVRRVLDGAAAVPAAGVASDFLAVGDDPNGVVVGANEDGLAHELVRNRVAVGVEPDPGFLRHDRGHDELGVGRMLRQRPQARALHEQPVGWALARGAVDAKVCDLVTPVPGLATEVVASNRIAASRPPRPGETGRSPMGVRHTRSDSRTPRTEAS